MLFRIDARVHRKMAAEDVSELVEVDPAARLSQFLFVGKELSDYQPGNWFTHNYYIPSRINSIDELAGIPTKQLVPIELIKKAFQSNLVPHPETLIFALAVCCKQTKSNALREEAYNRVAEICASPEYLILLVKFVTNISQFKDMDPNGKASHGWGHGLRKAISTWYLSKNPLELAKCVLRCKGRHGWKHKDILKLSHIATNNPEMSAVLKYVMHGLEYTKKTFPDNEGVAEILRYIEDVEKFKRNDDETEAASLLEMHGLTLDHVPGHLIKSPEIWNALIPTMDTKTLLKNLQRIHNFGHLKGDAPAVAKVIDRVTNQDNLSRDKVHPTLVLITIRNYENSGKPLSFEKRKVREGAKKPLPLPPKPNSKIIDGLYKCLNLSFGHLAPTGLRYMVTINMNKPMLESRAWQNANLNGAEAGCIIALSLLRCEKFVTVATFKNSGIHIVHLDKTATFGQCMRKLQQMPVGIVNLSKPMQCAWHQNYKYDVFINIVDQIYEKSDTSEDALLSYRTKMKIPNAKLINCAVCSSTTYQKETRGKGILTINGFDSSVPMVIEAFAKSLF